MTRVPPAERLLLLPVVRCVQPLIPSAVHPNAITLLGALFALAAYVYASTGRVLPYVVCHLLYVLLDGLDGAHARATRQGSVFGSVLDHAVDGLFGPALFALCAHTCVSTIVESSSCATLCLICFTFIHIWHDVTGVLCTGYPVGDVEGHLLFMVSFLVGWPLPQGAALAPILLGGVVTMVGSRGGPVVRAPSAICVIHVVWLCVVAYCTWGTAAQPWQVGAAVWPTLLALLWQNAPHPPPTRVYVDMCADLFHCGHVNFLRQCKELSPHATLLVGLHDDATMVAYKRPPVCSLEERMAVVRACRYVDEVVGGAPLVVSGAYLATHKVDLVVHADGIDEASKQLMYGAAIRLNKYREVPRLVGISTTDIIQRVSQRASLR